jgi:hypothetical protein
MMKVLQIVPRLRPSVCGVGDYSVSIAQEMRTCHGIETRFLVGDPGWDHGGEVEGFAVERVGARTSGNLAAAIRRLECDAVILQYSGYGFHKRGAPLWLLRGLAASGHPHVLTMFHELYAVGPVRSSAFWLSPLMRWIAHQLAAMSKHVFVSRQDAARWLGCDGCTVLPIFSSLGEIADPLPMSRRPNHLALFAYQGAENAWYWERLQSTLKILKPERVVALGRSPDVVERVCGGVLVERTGILPAEEVAGHLAACRYGYLSYPPSLLGKSSILAAYAGNALGTILADDAVELSEGLELGRHLHAASGLREDIDWDAASVQLTAWYRRHDRRATTAEFAKRLS